MSAALVATALGVLYASAASASTLLLVDSLGTEGASGTPTDGICMSTAGTCTLRAAIEESNAIGGAPGEVTIGIAPALAGGNIDPTSAPVPMRTAALYGTQDGGVAGSILGDSGAVFEVTAPVTIDLEHKITIHGPAASDIPGPAVFYINGKDIVLTGMDDVLSTETSFYIGPRAKNVTITDISVRTQNYHPERFVVVRGGARDITISNNTVSGFYSILDGGWGWVDGTSAAFPVTGLDLVGNTYKANATGSTACSASTANGCSSSPLNAVGEHVNGLLFADNRVENLSRLADTGASVLKLDGATVDTVTITGNTVVNPSKRIGAALIDFGAGTTVGTFAITENVFTDVSAQGDLLDGLIRLPVDRSVTSGLIARNTFRAIDVQSHAIFWNGPFGDAVNVTSSGVVIEDNYFDGWDDSATVATVRLYQTGAVTVRRNVFGTQTGTQTNTVSEEGLASGSYAPTMVSNWSYGANGKMNTWFPTARTSADVQAAAVTAVACVVPLEVAPPSDTTNTADLTLARYPSSPVTLDVYWTADRTAEVYLGSYRVTSNARTTLQVPLPSRPGDAALAHLPAGATLPVDPGTGAVRGGLRLQTQDPNAGGTVVSSHYSRVATIDGTCAPVLTVAQRDDQTEQSLVRDRVFRLTSSVPLDPTSVATSDVSLSGSTATRARVVDITQVDETTFDITVHADDTGTVVVAVGTGAVASTLGVANVSPATTGATEATDNVLGYVNPLTVDPSTMVIVTGDPAGDAYTIATRPGAPVPTADVVFTSTLDADATQYRVVPSTTAPTIPAGRLTTPTVTVTAADASVPADTAAAIHHAVTSQDVNYDGLVVPDAALRLFSTAPGVAIAKNAYTDVVDTSSPQSIEATGRLAPPGSRLTDRQAVCWVYTVTNTSQDDWATVLRDITVTDTDTRLGSGGTIGTIATLPVGESTKLAACAAIVAQDTTQGSGG